LDKKLSLKLNGYRHVQRILWGFDLFKNLGIDECVEIATRQNNIGMVVIQGNSIIMLEALKRECLHSQEKSTASTCPLSTAPVLPQNKNWVMHIFILNLLLNKLLK
ncbi:small nuclear ribonucleoprotein G-like, partial [Myotis myotis]|uniref:small nuclear ribonucleoprotein G-like n=1 Tax=Myotis myotis TaxID=51298 RepID=UPI001749546E